MIDGNALVMWLTDWWYSSFGQEETEESKLIREVLDEVVKYVEKYHQNGEWIPVTEAMPNPDDCPMDCLVTRKSEYIGAYVDMAVAERDGTWTHEDWKAIVLGLESGRETGLISTQDDSIVAWMPMVEPWKEPWKE